MTQLGLVFFPAFDWAISHDHPEREERLLYTRDQILEEGLFDFPGIEEFRPGVASPREIARAHICVPSVERGGDQTAPHRGRGGQSPPANSWSTVKPGGLLPAPPAGPPQHADCPRRPRFLYD